MNLHGARIAAILPHARLVEIEHGGHMLHHAHAAEIVASIEAYWSFLAISVGNLKNAENGAARFETSGRPKKLENGVDDFEDMRSPKSPENRSGRCEKSGSSPSRLGRRIRRLQNRQIPETGERGRVGTIVGNRNAEEEAPHPTKPFPLGPGRQRARRGLVLVQDSSTSSAEKQGHEPRRASFHQHAAPALAASLRKTLHS